MTKAVETDPIQHATLGVGQTSVDLAPTIAKAKSANDLPTSLSMESTSQITRSESSSKLGKKREPRDLLKRESTSSTPYDKLVQALHYDQRAKWELAAGKRIGFYSLKGDIGSGNFSKVKVAMHALTKERVAVKILDKTKMDTKTKKLLSGEIASMETLHHPNIIKLYEVIHTKSKLYIVMEYACGGELFSRLSSHGKMSENDAKIIFSQILSAVEHMHNHKIIHRDLKAENVFYSEKKMVKVGDFGFSTKAHGSADALDTFCGSPPYAAPELFRDSFYYGEYVDVWALGILLYFTVTGTLPFRAETVGKLKKKILLGQFTVPSHVSRDCKHLICHILKTDSSQRLSISEIKQSSWLNGVPCPIPNSFLKLNPRQVIIGDARPEEAYALYMLDKFGIKEDQMSCISEENATGRHSLSMAQNGQDITLHTTVDTVSSIIGTYRILLHRAYQKLTHSSQDDIRKMSAITNHITGRSSSVSPSPRFCTMCNAPPVTKNDDITAQGDATVSEISINNNVPRRKSKGGVSGLSQRTRSKVVKSKFCTLL